MEGWTAGKDAKVGLGGSGRATREVSAHRQGESKQGASLSFFKSDRRHVTLEEKKKGRARMQSGRGAVSIESIGAG